MVGREPMGGLCLSRIPPIVLTQTGKAQGTGQGDSHIEGREEGRGKLVL